jgi:SagB-type dehydrogenase family enzyme
MHARASSPRILRAALAAAPLLALATLAAAQEPPPIRLPEARRESAMSLEAALWARRSNRALLPDALTLADAAQLLWAAQGKNRPDGRRTIPSAHAVHALDVFLVAGNVEGLAAGVYRYRSATHDLVPVQTGDLRTALVGSPGRPSWAASAPLLVAFAVSAERAQRYGPQGDRWGPMEVGFAAQNVYLQAAALGLGTTFMGLYNDSVLTRALGPDERPMGVMPVGKPR